MGGLFGNLFGGDSETKVTSDTRSWTDSYNTSMSKNDIVADSGNTTVTLSSGDGTATGSTSWKKYMPILAVLCFGLAVLLFLTRKEKPWEK